MDEAGYTPLMSPKHNMGYIQLLYRHHLLNIKHHTLFFSPPHHDLGIIIPNL